MKTSEARKRKYVIKLLFVLFFLPITHLANAHLPIKADLQCLLLCDAFQALPQPTQREEPCTLSALFHHINATTPEQSPARRVPVVPCAP